MVNLPCPIATRLGASGPARHGQPHRSIGVAITCSHHDLADTRIDVSSVLTTGFRASSSLVRAMNGVSRRAASPARPDRNPVDTGAPRLWLISSAARRTGRCWRSVR